MSIACPALIGRHAPQLCAAVDHYCERTSAALGAEPVNAATNAAFLIAAWAAWRLAAAHPGVGDRLLIRVLIVTIAVIGLGSFLFHTVATRWAEWGDVLPILLFMVLYLWLVMTVIFGWAIWLKIIGLAAYFAVTFSIEAVVPPLLLSGGALYVPTLVVMIAIATALHKRHRGAGRAMLAATGLFLLSFAARTLDLAVCPALPLGTHFVWHLLNAVLLYLLIRIVVLYGTSRAPT